MELLSLGYGSFIISATRHTEGVSVNPDKFMCVTQAKTHGKISILYRYDAGRE